ncbi:acetylornithine transaminase [Loigolactobacillus coryniformis]|uniref:Acetylornithine aminotransferase n=1 Tax=Loigolactobacillus coryniformis subsp. torquens DSM 20004 = KCTC 3535 TaxID=1423822 RepID=A0A2D1KL20_9LACO|nr:acetylornithine transaminase [Loigolactobacillus coryniformis]ATO42814.1 acetylornithine transaminase [Loigolactobacillus coryniformis subsp. torquens DSM 20004 = KCTC 3535]KRK83422.1 acetylornithine aminotransferase [Loigolactobacillus coryniformis subsp. torquens DSM 20004 = KCTC 3535]
MSKLFPTYARYPFDIVNGHDCYLADDHGNTYLDFTSGIGVCNLGYSNAAVQASVAKQAQKIWHTSNLYQSQLQEQVATLLVGDADKLVFFCNSGTEANEAALKLARKASGKSAVLAFSDSFHGRTYGALSMTDNPAIQVGFGPLVPDIRFAPYNDVAAITQITADLAAVILEVVQGEGGVNPASSEWLHQVAAKCKQERVLLIIDEVQTGNGRTGQLFAYQNYDLQPDIVTTAKGLANGLPVGALIGNADLASAFTPGSHGTTFGGNKLAMAAAKAVLTQLTPAFLAQVQAKAAYLEQLLQTEIAPLSQVTGITGLGLMQGIHLNVAVGPVVTALQHAQLLTLSAKHDTLRLLPPLTITEEQLAQGVATIKQVLQPCF